MVSNRQETHQRSHQKEIENERAAQAFGIRDYVPGAAFNKEEQLKKKQEVYIYICYNYI